MQNYKQPGDIITLTAPSGGVTGGTAYKIGQLLVVAMADAAEGEPFEGRRTGVVTLPKNTSDAFSEGQRVFWDDGASECVNAATTGDHEIGVCVAAALAADTTLELCLHGIATADA
jgi:predicted RecA/RadA family phage recombinase